MGLHSSYLIEFWLPLRASSDYSVMNPKVFLQGHFSAPSPHPTSLPVVPEFLIPLGKEKWAPPRSMLPSTWEAKEKVLKPSNFPQRLFGSYMTHSLLLPTLPGASTAMVKVCWENKVHLRGTRAKPLISQKDEGT